MEYDPTKLKPYLKQKREATNKELYSLCNATTDNQKGSIRKLKSRILKDIENVETPETPKQKTIKKSNQNSQPPNFIDDPDELLMSVAIRELNRSTPDPRWASILINCKKENISIKSEVLDQLQKLPTQQLIEILKKQSGNSLQIE